MLMIIAVILVLVLIIFSWYLSTYNDLVSSENFIDHAFSGIDVQLTKRYDLIPNLVSVVKNYMVHERETLTEITALRSKAVSGKLSYRSHYYDEPTITTRHLDYNDDGEYDSDEGGDEINLIKFNQQEIPNYGWAISSYGEHYGGKNAAYNKKK